MRKIILYRLSIYIIEKMSYREKRTSYTVRSTEHVSIKRFNIMKLVRGFGCSFICNCRCSRRNVTWTNCCYVDVGRRCRLRRCESALEVIVGSLECDSEVPLSVSLPWRRPQPAEPTGPASIYIFYTILWHNTILFR